MQGDDIYDAMLNQTNVGENNNKFYVIQLLGAIPLNSLITFRLFVCRGRSTVNRTFVLLLAPLFLSNLSFKVTRANCNLHGTNNVQNLMMGVPIWYTIDGEESV